MNVTHSVFMLVVTVFVSIFIICVESFSLHLLELEETCPQHYDWLMLHINVALHKENHVLKVWSQTTHTKDYFRNWLAPSILEVGTRKHVHQLDGHHALIHILVYNYNLTRHHVFNLSKTLLFTPRSNIFLDLNIFSSLSTTGLSWLFLWNR